MPVTEATAANDSVLATQSAAYSEALGKLDKMMGKLLNEYKLNHMTQAVVLGGAGSSTLMSAPASFAATTAQLAASKGPKKKSKTKFDIRTTSLLYQMYNANNSLVEIRATAERTEARLDALEQQLAIATAAYTEQMAQKAADTGN